MMETDDVDHLAAYIRDKRYCRIGVDGTSGAGKSTMASALARALGLNHVNLDDYLVKKQGGFLDHLRYDDIKRKTSELGCFVIDGVCLLSVLEEIETSVDCLVYVKRICHGLWADEDECEVTEDVEGYIRKERETVGLVEGSEKTPDTLGLAEEIIRYHDKYKPHREAELFYTREDC
ncbi:MAG: hypothetical protein SFU55_02120 [Methylophilus sp.]|nr:hypothetical protein [Methylophilus sp.]